MFSHCTKGDKILILALIADTLSVFFLQRESKPHQDQRRVSVELDNRLVRSFMLREEAHPRWVTMISLGVVILAWLV